MSDGLPTRLALAHACGEFQTDANGEGSYDLPAPNKTRWVAGGEGEFDNPLPGDKVLGLEVIHPTGTVIGSFTDTDMPAENQGWFILNAVGRINVPSELGLKAIPAGCKIRIRVKKAAAVIDTFRFNVRWGR